MDPHLISIPEECRREPHAASAVARLVNINVQFHGQLSLNQGLLTTRRLSVPISLNAPPPIRP